MSRARTNKENRPKRPSTLGLLLGGTGGRKDASKGAEAERQRRRRERDRSREMAAYVGYDAMYRDGIAQVMPGVFSQTVEFSDISYQSARKEARETAFTVMSSLFNYFPADSHVQLQVVNAPIPADEVGRKVFFEPGERATAGLAEEYNRILNDKMREGVSNLVRHRYLTYAVGADDVDAAVPKLARIRGDVEQTLARIRCSSRALDGAERLELLQGQLRPGSRFEFSWDKLSPTSGARTKDFVMPSTLDFKPEGRSDCFCSDGRYGAVLAVRPEDIALRSASGAGMARIESVMPLGHYTQIILVRADGARLKVFIPKEQALGYIPGQTADYSFTRFKQFGAAQASA